MYWEYQVSVSLLVQQSAVAEYVNFQQCGHLLENGMIVALSNGTIW